MTLLKVHSLITDGIGIDAAIEIGKAQVIQLSKHYWEENISELSETIEVYQRYKSTIGVGIESLNSTIVPCMVKP